MTTVSSVECPHCHLRFAPGVLWQHIRDKHPTDPVSCPKNDPGCDGGDGGCHDTCETPPTFYTVSLTIHDRAYGGPEEGGWYFETYEPQRPQDGQFLPVICLTIEEAMVARDKMEVAIVAANLNEGRREIGSVLSDGVYCAHIYDELPRPQPQERPVYS